MDQELLTILRSIESRIGQVEKDIAVLLAAAPAVAALETRLRAIEEKAARINGLVAATALVSGCVGAAVSRLF